MVERFVVEKLHSLTQFLNIKDCCFSVDFSDVDSLMVETTWEKSLVGRKDILFSSSNAERYARESIKQISQNKANLRRLSRNNVHHWQIESHSSQAELLSRYGYSNKLSVSVPICGLTKVVGRFFFLIDDDVSTQHFNIHKLHYGRLIKVAVELNEKHELSRNLLSDYGLLRTKTISVINLLSLGKSREDVALELYLTPRGVDYHVDLAKTLLSASNIPALIHRCGQYGMFG